MEVPSRPRTLPFPLVQPTYMNKCHGELLVGEEEFYYPKDISDSRTLVKKRKFLRCHQDAALIYSITYYENGKGETVGNSLIEVVQATDEDVPPFDGYLYVTLVKEELPDLDLEFDKYNSTKRIRNYTCPIEVLNNYMYPDKTWKCRVQLVYPSQFDRNTVLRDNEMFKPLLAQLLHERILKPPPNAIKVRVHSVDPGQYKTVSRPILDVSPTLRLLNRAMEEMQCDTNIHILEMVIHFMSTGAIHSQLYSSPEYLFECLRIAKKWQLKRFSDAIELILTHHIDIYNFGIMLRYFIDVSPIITYKMARFFAFNHHIISEEMYFWNLVERKKSMMQFICYRAYLLSRRLLDRPDDDRFDNFEAQFDDLVERAKLAQEMLISEVSKSLTEREILKRTLAARAIEDLFEDNIARLQKKSVRKGGRRREKTEESTEFESTLHIIFNSHLLEKDGNINDEVNKDEEDEDIMEIDSNRESLDLVKDVYNADVISNQPNFQYVMMPISEEHAALYIASMKALSRQTNFVPSCIETGDVSKNITVTAPNSFALRGAVYIGNGSKQVINKAYLEANKQIQARLDVQYQASLFQKVKNWKITTEKDSIYFYILNADSVNFSDIDNKDELRSVTSKLFGNLTLPRKSSVEEIKLLQNRKWKCKNGTPIHLRDHSHVYHGRFLIYKPRHEPYQRKQVARERTREWYIKEFRNTQLFGNPHAAVEKSEEEFREEMKKFHKMDIFERHLFVHEVVQNSTLRIAAFLIEETRDTKTVKEIQKVNEYICPNLETVPGHKELICTFIPDEYCKYNLLQIHLPYIAKEEIKSNGVPVTMQFIFNRLTYALLDEPVYWSPQLLIEVPHKLSKFLDEQNTKNLSMYGGKLNIVKCHNPIVHEESNQFENPVKDRDSGECSNLSRDLHGGINECNTHNSNDTEIEENGSKSDEDDSDIENETDLERAIDNDSQISTDAIIDPEVYKVVFNRVTKNETSSDSNFNSENEQERKIKKRSSCSTNKEENRYENNSSSFSTTSESSAEHLIISRMLPEHDYCRPYIRFYTKDNNRINASRDIVEETDFIAQMKKSRYAFYRNYDFNRSNYGRRFIVNHFEEIGTARVLCNSFNTLGRTNNSNGRKNVRRASPSNSVVMIKNPRIIRYEKQKKYINTASTAVLTQPPVPTTPSKPTAPTTPTGPNAPTTPTAPSSRGKASTSNTNYNFGEFDDMIPPKRPCSSIRTSLPFFQLKTELFEGPAIDISDGANSTGVGIRVHFNRVSHPVGQRKVFASPEPTGEPSVILCNSKIDSKYPIRTIVRRQARSPPRPNTTRPNRLHHWESETKIVGNSLAYSPCSTKEESNRPCNAFPRIGCVHDKHNKLIELISSVTNDTDGNAFLYLLRMGGGGLVVKSAAIPEQMPAVRYTRVMPDIENAVPQFNGIIMSIESTKKGSEDNKFFLRIDNDPLHPDIQGIYIGHDTSYISANEYGIRIRGYNLNMKPFIDRLKNIALRDTTNPMFRGYRIRCHIVHPVLKCNILGPGRGRPDPIIHFSSLCGTRIHSLPILYYIPRSDSEFIRLLNISRFHRSHALGQRPRVQEVAFIPRTYPRYLVEMRLPNHEYLLRCFAPLSTNQGRFDFVNRFTDRLERERRRENLREIEAFFINIPENVVFQNGEQPNIGEVSTSGEQRPFVQPVEIPISQLIRIGDVVVNFTATESTTFDVYKPVRTTIEYSRLEHLIYIPQNWNPSDTFTAMRYVL